MPDEIPSQSTQPLFQDQPALYRSPDNVVTFPAYQVERRAQAQGGES